jgi:cytochrome c-type biogenesis protein CcmH/NrfG
MFFAGQQSGAEVVHNIGLRARILVAHRVGGGYGSFSPRTAGQVSVMWFLNKHKIESGPRIRVFRFSLLTWSFSFLLCGSVAAQTTPSSSQLADDLSRAETALKANDQATAAHYFHSALERDPANVQAHANLGAIAFLQGDCPVAEQEFRSALQVSPGLIKAQALLSICERRQGEPAAQADMENAFAKLDDPKLRLQIGVELADGYYQQGDLEKTAATLHTLLNLSPDNIDILFFAQRVYSELADNTLNKLAVLAPDSARMEQLIAERLINAGDLKSATMHYRKALQMNPKLPGIHFELAETLMESSPNIAATQKEARSELEAAIQADGDSSKVQCLLGRIALLQSDTAQAYSHYHRAYELDPKNPQAQIGLAEILRLQDKPEEAADYLRMAVAADPFNPDAHYKLSQVDRILHRDEEQKKELQLFLDIRATREKVKLLYRQMNPQANVHEDAASGSKP